MRYKLVIFDMDGTILNTIDDINAAVNNTLEKYGFEAKTVDETKMAVGNGLRLTLIRSLPEYLKNSILEKDIYEVQGFSQSLFDEMLAYFIKYYGEHSAEQTRPYEKITDVIKSLKDAGYLTAVVSNKRDSAVQDLCVQFYEGLFDVKLGEIPGQKPKPAPDSVYKVMEELGISSEETVYIGDSDVDLATARNAGIDCIAVSWGFRTRAFLEENGANIIIDTPLDIINILNGK